MKILPILLLLSLTQVGAAMYEVVERAEDRPAYRIAGQALPEGGIWVEALPGDYANDYVGQQVSAEIAEREDGSQVLLSVFPHDAQMSAVMRQANANLRRDTVERGRRVMRNLGDYLPEFGMWDETGRIVTEKDFRGRHSVVNFIFTRCPTPEMCPAQTMRMARLQRAIADAGLADQVEFVSFTLDPEYDSPGILREYAETRGLDLENFTLLTGPKRALDDLYRQFGIIAFEADGTIEHTIATLVISPMGKIVHRKDGSRWSAKEFEEILKERILNKSK